MRSAVWAGALLLSLRAFAGCRRPPDEPAIVETIENAAAVAQYKALLADCRKAAVDAGSIAVFDRCADEVDAELCRTRALRCEGGAK